MKIFYITNFIGRCPGGTAAIVVADDSMAAADLLLAELEKRGNKQYILPSDFTKMVNVSVRANKEQVTILLDGAN